ncbi:MAG: hypothetical protein ACKO65_07725 [Betaproteobacteria bacterium]|jgi:hypothetical protein
MGPLLTDAGAVALHHFDAEIRDMIAFALQSLEQLLDHMENHTLGECLQIDLSQITSL